MNSRPLKDCYAGISVSESETSSAHGFPSEQVNRVTFDIASALLGQGAGVVFGHDWRPDGVMEAICRFALLMAPEILTAAGGPLMENLLPWPPERLHLKEEDRDRLGAILRIEQLYLPEELSQYRRADLGKGPLKDYLRARGLTHLRHALDAHSNARVCVGGKTRGYAGRYPGIFEEAYFSVESKKPLYLAGLFGGATTYLIRAIMGEPMPTELDQVTERMRDVYKQHATLESSEDTRADRVVDLKQVWSAFQELGLSGLSRLNGLSEEENRALFDGLVLEQTIYLILAGLGRLCREGRMQPPFRS